jgi:NAD(P)H-hydrate repair Nnr-like enzyme with NAD(P)H-hydrate dehydratase domain
MLAVVGTIPDKKFPLVSGEVVLQDNELHIQGYSLAIQRGTSALIAAAVKTLAFLKKPCPFAYLVGDIGLGDGSRYLYEHVTHHIESADFSTITFHYLQPDVDWCNRIMFAIEEMASRPVLIADAGSMYMAKMSGNAPLFDLFTPDAGELAFLADEDAPHPFYTRGFILHEGNLVPDLIKRAYSYENAARYLLVKGEQDYISNKDEIIEVVNSPQVPALEPIGGTGDVLTGIVSGLIEAGWAIGKAAVVAARVNRFAGYYATPSPATQVAEIIENIPRALDLLINASENLETAGNVQ